MRPIRLIKVRRVLASKSPTKKGRLSSGAKKAAILLMRSSLLLTKLSSGWR